MMMFRNLRSCAQNFIHFFLQYSNYDDGGYVVENLREAARGKFRETDKSPFDS